MPQNILEYRVRITTKKRRTKGLFKAYKESIFYHVTECHWHIYQKQLFLLARCQLHSSSKINNLNALSISSRAHNIFRLKIYTLINNFKGSVRPDWIYMRVAPLDRPWKGHQLIEVFDFLISLLNIWKTSCLFGSRSAYNPAFLLAGTLFFDEKIRQNAALFWFGFRDVRILYSRAVIQRTIDVSLHIWSTLQRKRFRFEHMQTVIQSSRRLDFFCMKWLRTLNSYQIIKIKNKKI